jgi:hypothetical protein
MNTIAVRLREAYPEDNRRGVMIERIAARIIGGRTMRELGRSSMLVALAASYLQARRAARVDP